MESDCTRSPGIGWLGPIGREARDLGIELTTLGLCDLRAIATAETSLDEGHLMYIICGALREGQYLNLTLSWG